MKGLSAWQPDERGKRRRRRARQNKCVYERQRDRLRTHGVVKAALFDYSPVYRLPVRRGHVGTKGMIQLKTTSARSWSGTVTQQIQTHITNTHLWTHSLNTIRTQHLLRQRLLGRRSLKESFLSIFTRSHVEVRFCHRKIIYFLSKNSDFIYRKSDFISQFWGKGIVHPKMKSKS